VTTAAPTARPTAPSISREVVAALCVTAGFLLWPLVARLFGFEPSAWLRDMVAASLQTLAAGAGGVMSLVSSRRCQPELTRSWRLIGLGLLAWTAGNVTYLVLASNGTEPGVPSWADLGYALSLPLLAAGVFSWPTDTARRTDVGAAIDGLICATSIVLLLWIGFFRTVAVSRSSPTSEIVVSLLYPLVDIIILLVLVVAVRRTRPGNRQHLLLLTLGLGAVLVADTLYSVTTAGDLTTVPAVLEDTPWVFGYVLIALWALRSLRFGTPAVAKVPARRTGSADDPDAFEDESVSAVATYLAGAGLLAAVVSFAFGDTVDLTTVVVGGTLLLEVLARQAWTVRVNNRMTGQLRADIDELARQAQRDALTGLPNRVGLDDRIVAAGRRAATLDRTAAVMFVDLDHLKTVNDSLGHAAGDQLITTMANRLTARLGDRVTRFGGDEFVIVLDDLADTEALDRLAESVVADGTRTIDLGGIELRPSVSVGAAVAEPSTEPAELLRRADIALYRSKAAGRQRSARFHPRMDHTSRRRIDLEPELRRAVERDEFVVYFQPVVALEDRQLLGAESLLRWHHPTRGLVLPGDFLVEADLAGLMAAIGERTTMKACQAFADANSRPGQHAVAVSVNMSASELEDRHAVARVGLALDKTGLEPSLLAIEITEDVIINRTVRRTIDDLVDLGVTLSIDDFGTGNSSLRQLGAYPANALKIDKSYVDTIDQSAEGEKVVRALVGLAERFGLFTIAEGVERESQVDRLLELGCYAGQGWVFDRALPYQDFAARWLDPA
jgi:diguanylate cyclase (GGDEF)-like protein